MVAKNCLADLQPGEPVAGGLESGSLEVEVRGPCVPAAAGMGFRCFVLARRFVLGLGSLGFYDGSFGAAGLLGAPRASILGT